METTDKNARGITSVNRSPEAFRIAIQLRSAVVGIFVVVITVSMIGVFGLGVKTSPPGSILDGGAQIGLISLIIALAAYLAVLSRELKEKIKGARDGERIEHEKNLEGIICAEQLVVGLGLLGMLRILVRPFLGPTTMLADDIPVTIIDFLDVFVIAVFAGVVLFLAWLHYRQWR